MKWQLTPEAFLELARNDAEFLYKLNGFDGIYRLTIPPASVDLLVEQGKIQSARVAEGEARLALNVPDGVLALAAQQVPPPGYESAMTAQFRGVTFDGDPITAIAPYAGLLSRTYDLLRRADGTVQDVPAPAREPFRDTDDAIGRYVWITVDGIDYRIFYEEAGHGERVLLLHHTAGADGRQWRHQLADPEFKSRFRVIAYDLPYHGRSMPPSGANWWSSPYLPTREWMMKAVLAIMDALKIERPIFMGCSVGGQLALDLSAEHGERFAASISLNGTLDNPSPDDPMMMAWNEICRDNRFSNEFYAIGNFGATSPYAPEAYRRDLYWIYRSNFPGVYAGDNDYFLHGHDLKINGRGIDCERTPTYLLAGEYDPVSCEEEHGGPAVARLFPGVQYRELKRLGHFAPSDDPVGFNASLLPILDEVVGRIR